MAPSFSSFVSSVVAAWVASGGSVSVGCAVGADAAVVSSFLSSPLGLLSLRVFCVGGPGPSGSLSGFWSGSAVSVLSSLWCLFPSALRWWAGGPVSVPLRGRLLRRSAAALVGASCACFFLSSPSSPGSLRVAALAASRGLPVFVFACGFSGCPAPLAGCCGSLANQGRWVSSSFCGFPCLAWSSSPAGQLALF